MVLSVAPPLNASLLYVWGHGGQGTTSNIIFNLGTESSIGLELGKQARLTDQQVPVICLSLSPWC